MMILRESLGVVSHRAVLAAKREIETRRSGERCELEWRGNSKRWIDIFGPRQLRPKSYEKCHQK
jgi:hypothetical protein